MTTTLNNLGAVSNGSVPTGSPRLLVNANAGIRRQSSIFQTLTGNNHYDRHEFELNRKLTAEFEKANFKNVKQVKPWTHILQKILIGLCFCCVIGFSWSVFVLHSSAIYILSTGNLSVNFSVTVTSAEIVDAPFFICYVYTASMILLYPLYVILMLIWRKGKFRLGEQFRNHSTILTGETPEPSKIAMRCIVSCLLWYGMIYSMVKSLKKVLVIDAVTIFCVHPCMVYLLCWTLLHKQFVAIKIIAFITSASSILMNVYMNQQVMWYKVLTVTATGSYALLVVFIKMMVPKPSVGQVAWFLSSISLIGSLTTWILVIVLIVSTSTEICKPNWTYFPVEMLFGSSIALIVYMMSSQVASKSASRISITLATVISIPITMGLQVMILKQTVTFPSMKIAATILAILSAVMTSLPQGWSNGIANFVKKRRKNAANNRNIRNQARQNRLKSIATLQNQQPPQK